MGKKDIIQNLQREIVIPDIVQRKADLAFRQIKRESAKEKSTERVKMDKKDRKKEYKKTDNRKDCQKEMKRSLKRRRKKTVWTILAAALLLLGTMTACAAAYIHWSKGMEEELHATPEKKIILEEEKMVSDISETSVTDAGVTITPILSVTDSQFSRMAFRISGYDLPEGVEPGFEWITIDGVETVSSGGSFYNGMHRDEEGEWKYDDGSDLKENGNGGWIERYVADDGTMEYDLYLVGRSDQSLIGQKMHLEFQNLGTVEKAAFTPDITGTWAFDIELKGSEETRSLTLNAPLGESGAAVASAEITPISIHVVYHFGAQEIEVEADDATTGEKFTTTMYEEPPALTGVRLKDGTLLTGIMGAGWMGWDKETENVYESCQMTNHILDTEQVDALLFIKSLPDTDRELTEEDLYIVPIEEE